MTDRGGGRANEGNGFLFFSFHTSDVKYSSFFGRGVLQYHQTVHAIGRGGAERCSYFFRLFIVAALTPHSHAFIYLMNREPQTFYDVDDGFREIYSANDEAEFGETFC